MFGQVVVGPPGSGKTTYCRGMQQFLRSIGRNAVVVNLDPANDADRDVLAAEEGFEECAVDINELVTLQDVMEELKLGPNGGMVYCLEFLECNLEWLENKLKGLLKDDPKTYFLFDLPGQVEIAAHHPSLKNIMSKIQKRLGLRLASIQLVDSYHCSDASKYISAVFLSLSTMLRLELPHVNVLSKIDMIEKLESEGSLPFNLDFYTQVMDLEYLLPVLPNTPRYLVPSDQILKEVTEISGEENNEEGEQGGRPTYFFEERFKKLNGAICDLIEQYSLVAFHTLNIQDKDSVIRLIRHIDKVNDYNSIKGDEERALLDQTGEFLEMSSLMEQYMPGTFQ